MPVAELDKFRAKYPQYSDMQDIDLATKLATKYPAYADLPKKVAMENNAANPAMQGGAKSPANVWAQKDQRQAAYNANPVVNNLNRMADNARNTEKLLPFGKFADPKEKINLRNVTGESLKAASFLPGVGPVVGGMAYGTGLGVEDPSKSALGVAKEAALGGAGGRALEVAGPVIAKAIPKIISKAGDMLGGKSTQEAFDNLINKHAQVYRTILNPHKGVIQKVEIKSGKDLDNTFKLAAKEGIIIDKDANNKLDTSGAVKQLQPKVDALNDQLEQVLSQNKNKTFDLNSLASKAKLKLNGQIKNALELKAAKAHVDDEIRAEIERHGTVIGKNADGSPIYDPHVDGPTLNQIKKGMWSKSYDPMAPNKNVVARQVGVAAKDAIEHMFPTHDVKGINQQLGQYYDLRNVLENAHGGIIQKGKVGRYAAQITGTIAGHATGVPGAEVGGAWIGGKASDFLNDPQRITEGLSSKLVKLSSKAANDTNPIAGTMGDMDATSAGKVFQESNVKRIPTNEEPMKMLPAPKMDPNRPQYLKDREEIPKQEIPTGEAISDNPIPLKDTLHKASEQINDMNQEPPGSLTKGLPAAALVGGAGMTTLGQKNNNPINLKGTQKWDGMKSKDRQGHAVFIDQDHGIRAGLRDLTVHKRKNPNQTLKQFLNSFAEANGDQEAKFIADHLKIDVNSKLKDVDMFKAIIPLARIESKTKLTDADIARIKKKFHL